MVAIERVEGPEADFGANGISVAAKKSVLPAGLDIALTGCEDAR